MNVRFSLVLITVFVLIQPIAAEAFSGGGMKGKRSEGRIGGGSIERQDDGAPPVQGPDPEVMGAFFPQRASREAMEKRGFISTGLEAIYPDSYDCPKATSLFASPSRSDGSRRPSRFFEGLHGGMDIPQPEGTPLLALADGEVIAKHEGEAGGIGGLGIWMRHAPEDTGTGKYVFVEYKHLAKLPDLAIGERVKMGQVIAATGNTGTAGGYYGSNGFYHLHMTAYWSDVPEFTKRSMVPIGARWLDPLALMRGGPLDSYAVRDLPQVQKKVRIPFKTSNGLVFPERTKVVWPYACKPM